MVGKKELRAYVPDGLHRVLRAIAGLKNGDRDWNLTDIVIEACEEWLQKPENQKLIKDHGLEKLRSSDKKSR